METVVNATIPTDQFVLEETIERVTDVEFESVRFAVDSSTCSMPFLWGSTSHPNRLDAALRDDPSTARVRCLSRTDGRGLYSIDWTERAACRITEFAETDGSVLDVWGTADRWTFQILFPDRSTASETFQKWCRDGIDPSLSRISSLSCPDVESCGLSATQHTTIAHAFQKGYYSVPRDTTLAELATEFDVSHQAMSERLRRGHSHLVRQMLSEPTASQARRP